jgi:hypothetical protein
MRMNDLPRLPAETPEEQGQVPITPPFYPIVYVRGYAATMEDIENTVATPYMGFNLGSTKIRQDHKNCSLSIRVTVDSSEEGLRVRRRIQGW